MFNLQSLDDFLGDERLFQPDERIKREVMAELPAGYRYILDYNDGTRPVKVYRALSDADEWEAQQRIRREKREADEVEYRTLRKRRPFRQHMFAAEIERLEAEAKTKAQPKPAAQGSAQSYRRFGPHRW